MSTSIYLTIPCCVGCGQWRVFSVRAPKFLPEVRSKNMLQNAMHILTPIFLTVHIVMSIRSLVPTLAYYVFWRILGVSDWNLLTCKCIFHIWNTALMYSSCASCIWYCNLDIISGNHLKLLTHFILWYRCVPLASLHFIHVIHQVVDAESCFHFFLKITKSKKHLRFMPSDIQTYIFMIW